MIDRSGLGHCSAFLTVFCICAWSPQTSYAQARVDTSTSDERAAAVKADLEEAVEMIEQGHLTLFVADFMAVDPRRSVGRGTISARDREQFEQLGQQLKSAIDAKPVFNRTRTLAQLTYILKPVQEIPEQPPEKIPDLMGKPLGKVSGFGQDLSGALFIAVGNLDAGRIDTFISGMYPLGELARLTQEDHLERLKFRLTQHPEMLRLMVRDLKQAASTDAVVREKSGSSETATITLPQTSNGGKPRTLKFELVDGDWRFFDHHRETRAVQQDLLSAPIAGYSIPGSQLTLMLRWDVDCWRLYKAPIVKPVAPDGSMSF